jgi:L-alanine-DL-glutamate epimerase-like enolase superfamily enzyme
MKIKRLSVFQKNLPLAKPYRLSGGRLLFTELDATFVKVETDSGLVGWGEGCPWGHTYLPAHGAGIRAAMPLLAAAVLGMEPRGLSRINAAMDAALPGHLYAKAPLDVACWDILGQSANAPLHEMLGGARGAAPIVSSTSTGEIAAMLAEADDWRARGYFRHSVKIGGDDLAADIERIRRHEQDKKPGERIIYDANRSWTPAQAISVMAAVADLPGLAFEQPCETLDQCAAVRARAVQPISIDERAETVGDMLKIAGEGIGEIVNIKLNRVGGLTKARIIRDIALASGIELLAMESGGSVVADTAAVHLAQTIPAASLVGTWLCHDMLAADTAPGAGARSDGKQGYAEAPAAAGLGVAPDEKIFGEALAVYQ